MKLYLRVAPPIITLVDKSGSEIVAQDMHKLLSKLRKYNINDSLITTVIKSDWTILYLSFIFTYF